MSRGLPHSPDAKSETAPDGLRDALSARLEPRAWVRAHARALISTLGGLAKAPGSTLLTAAVVGIALSLPVGLFLAVDSVAALTERWDRGAQLSVFLAPNVADGDAQRIGRELEGIEGIERVVVLDRSAALAELQRITGLQGIESAFAGHNPLPAVLLVDAKGRLSDRDARPALQSLAHELGARGDVDFVQFDTQWVGRLQALLELAKRSIGALGGLLGVGLLLVVGNTIRLAVESRRDEIAIAMLCGATDGFVRRPFLYTGGWYGILGGIVAAGIIAAGIAILSDPLDRLAALYAGGLEPLRLGAAGASSLVLTGGAVGFGGAWLAVSRQLRRLRSSDM